jgi:glutathione S-transferase
LSGGLKEYPNVQLLHPKIAADPAVQKPLAREAGK